MIVVDTSALMAIVLDEPQAETCMAAIEAADGLLISAGTVAEALIVAGRRNVGEEIAALIEGLGFEVVSAALDGGTGCGLRSKFGQTHDRSPRGKGAAAGRPSLNPSGGTLSRPSSRSGGLKWTILWTNLCRIAENIWSDVR